MTQMNQIIIHVDMDAFFAAVEMRDNPALRGKPLIIGALPSQRGVVATCNYAAREYGVHSAMNIKEAYRLCPTGIYLRPDMNKYKAVSAELRAIWADAAEKLESVAFDEAYLDQHDFPTGHPMLALRNIRTCEAHDELVTNLFRMILEGRVEEGRKTAEEIRELQKMPI